MKGGTTTLFAYLDKHPQVLMSSGKEIHYYDRYYKKGLGWYLSHFPLSFCVPKGSKVGEATPCYMFHPHTAKHIHGVNPQTKIILVLRDPIQRAISHYFHNKRKNKEELGMLEAFREEEARIARRYKTLLRNENGTDWEVANHSYKARGVYHRQLRRFRKHFPGSQILLLSTDCLAEDPKGTMKQVYEFIGVDPARGTVESLKENVGTNRKPVPEEVNAYLTEFFKPSNKAFIRRHGPVYSNPSSSEIQA